MGYMIEIDVCGKWHCTYFVQCMEEETAKKKAYKMFRDTVSCTLPATLKEAEKDDSFFIESKQIYQIIL